MRAMPLLLATLVSSGSAVVAAAPVDFDTQVMAVITRAGCNTGACHGAAVGRGGFKLSLYGSNAASDHDAIVHQLEGRRVNLVDPGRSLVVLKPTETLVHGGEQRFESDSESAGILRRWIAEGARRIGRRKLLRLEITPSSRVVARPGIEIEVRVTARFDVGPGEDVTRWTVLTAADTASVSVDQARGRLTVRRKGRHVVLARCLDQVTPIVLFVPLGDEPLESGDARPLNYIDQFVVARLEAMRIPASAPVDDAGFLRRVRLDLTGRLPVPEEVRGFLAEHETGKRERLVDRLLASDEFVEYWTWRLAQLLRVRSQSKETEGALAFHGWLRRQLAGKTGFDKLCRQLVTAEGDSHEVGPANFYRATRTARQQAEFLSQAMMGIRLRCANCHDHPLDRWTQDDYHGLAALFAGIERGRMVRYVAGAEVTHPRTGQAARPRLPGADYLPAGVDHRTRLADWLTRPGNPFFARAFANRLWQSLLGRGLVEPVDDHRATNPPTHPELLDRLADDFAANGFSIRGLLRRIATSDAYGRTARSLPGNRGDTQFYSHALVRPLPAEVLADALADVTGVPGEYPDQPAGTRAVALFDSRIVAPSLDILGRCGREGGCDTAAGGRRGLAARLHLLNGPLANRPLADPGGRLSRLLKAGRSDRELVEEFTLRSLSRLPSQGERRFWDGELKRADTRGRRAVIEDMVWSLVNCREFVTNH